MKVPLGSLCYAVRSTSGGQPACQRSSGNEEFWTPSRDYLHRIISRRRREELREPLVSCEPEGEKENPGRSQRPGFVTVTPDKGSQPSERHSASHSRRSLSIALSGQEWTTAINLFFDNAVVATRSAGRCSGSAAPATAGSVTAVRAASGGTARNNVDGLTVFTNKPPRVDSITATDSEPTVSAGHWPA